MTIGPEIGDYYDFLRDEPLTLDDLILIEKRMQEIGKRNLRIVLRVLDLDALKIFF